MEKLILITLWLIASFTGYNQMVVSGDASAQSCDCYTITPDANVQVGGVFSPNTIDLTNSFDFSFQIYLGVDDVWGADGIVFVLQQGQSADVNIAQTLGYQGLNPSIGVEVDVFQNSAAPYNDPASDHITIMSNGDFASVLSPSVNIPNIEDGAFHTFQVVWDATLQVLAITLDGNFISAYNGDIVNTIFGGNPNVYFGFTGATGGINNLQQLCMYRTASFTQTALNACVGQNITFTDNSTSDLNQITNYLWDFGDGSTSNLQNPAHSWATAGVKNVTLTITDITGCTSTTNVNITVSPGITVNIVPQNVSCNGANDGVLNTTPTNGTGPYTYVWDIPSNQQNPNNLSPNTYNLTITDNVGCTGTAQGVITEPLVLVIDNIATTDASCGLNNGTITVSASGGSTNYTYSINGGAFQASNLFSNLASGAYTVQVQDANNCIVNGNTNVSQASLLSFTSIVVTDVSCGGVPDGTITVNVANGANPLSYSLDGGPLQASNVFNGLSANTYSITVQDNNTCTITNNNVVVNSATAMTIDNIVPVDASCNGLADGSFEVFVSGGAPVVTYSADGGTTFQNSATFTGLQANNYAIQVMDGNNCILNGATVIGEPTVLSIDNIVVDNNVSCNGGSDGQITITASGGNGVYSYSLDAGVTTQLSNVFTNLAQNNYTLTLSDGPNCSTTTNGAFSITEPAVITSNTTVVDVSCNGLTDGEINIVANGGTPNLQYSIDGGTTYQNSANFTNLGIGSYTVQVTDNNTCPPTVVNVNIIESAPLSVSLGNPDTTICFGTSANICAQVTGGTAPYQYYWNGVTAVSGPQCLPLTVAGTVTIEITDDNGCTTNTVVSKDLIVLPQLTLISGGSSTICPGESVNLFAEASDGNGGPYTYIWTNDTNDDALNGANQTVFPIELTTNYTVSVTDGCSDPIVTNMVTVNVYSIPHFNISATPQVGCTPLESTFTNTIPSNLITSETWTFENGEVANTNSTTQVFTEPGCSDVTYSMTTADGCISDTTLIDYVCVNPYPVANFSFTPEDPDLLELEVTFYNESTDATTYAWEFGNGTVSSMVSPTYTYPEIGAIDYLVKLVAINNFGCKDSITKVVHVKELQYYYIPNSFTPEGNGTNETFAPIFFPGFTPANYRFSIFNRWGEVIYETNDIYSSWNGMYQGKLVSDEAYVWQITFRENETDKAYIQSGHVIVLY